MKKLTLISIKIKNKKYSSFVMGDLLPNGKTIVQESDIDYLFNKVCGLDMKYARGLTYTLG